MEKFIVPKATDTFLRKYSGAQRIEAVRSFVNSPYFSYPKSTSQEEAAIYNYVDSLIYGTPLESKILLRYLINLLESSTLFLLEYDEFLNSLQEDLNWIESPRNSGLSPDQTRILENFAKISAKFSEFDKWLLEPLADPHPPLFPMRYAGTSSDSMLWPLERDYSTFLEEYEGKIVLFSDAAHFFHCLQFNPIVEGILGAHFSWFILDRYPQNWGSPPQAKNIQLPSFLSKYEKAINSALNDHNLFYQVGKNIQQELQLNRLGTERAPALFTCVTERNWKDPHKNAAGEVKPIGLNAHFSNPSTRRKTKEKKLLHVVPQIVEKTHAPTQLLKQIIHLRKEITDVSIYSTERLYFRPQEYPLLPTHSPHSKERAAGLIHEWKEKGISVNCDDGQQSYVQTATALAQFIDENAFDIVVFHGPDIINMIAAQICSAPKKVLFEHGSLPAFPVFDLAITSTQEGAERWQKLYPDWPTQFVAHPFALDVRKNWEPSPPTKQSLGVPENSVIMTTISNHLEARLSKEMLHALCEILRKNPQAYYCPIGRVHKAEKLKEYFTAESVGEQVRLLGPSTNPSQLARGMDIYLNEFPFGSCLGMLDAMASGCPPVSMYDPNGPVQAQYAGSYFGQDRVIKEGNVKKYIELATQLIQDKDMYVEWSKEAERCFAKHADEKQYVEKLEEIILAT